MDSFVYKIYYEHESPLKFISRLLFTSFIVYLGYLSLDFIINYSQISANTYSVGGDIVNFFLIFLSIGMICFSFRPFISLSFFIFELVLIIVKEGPRYIQNEFYLIQRIWDNRGFRKYSLFGGVSFYFKLRQRILAYFFAFASISVVAWYFAFKQYEYEKTYWKVNFYYGEPIPTFTFKPDVPYTIKTGPEIYALVFNNNKYVVGRNSSWGQDKDYKISLYIPEKWNITFPETTQVEFQFYSEYINKIFSQSFEIWANQKEGFSVDPSLFVYEWQKEKPKITKQPKKKNKKKRR